MIRVLKKAIDEEIDGAANYFGIASEMDKMGVPYYITKYIYKMAEDELRHSERLEKILSILKGGS